MSCSGGVFDGSPFGDDGLGLNTNLLMSIEGKP